MSKTASLPLSFHNIFFSNDKTLAITLYKKHQTHSFHCRFENVNIAYIGRHCETFRPRGYKTFSSSNAYYKLYLVLQIVPKLKKLKL